MLRVREKHGFAAQLILTTVPSLHTVIHIFSLLSSYSSRDFGVQFLFLMLVIIVQTYHISKADPANLTNGSKLYFG